MYCDDKAKALKIQYSNGKSTIANIKPAATVITVPAPVIQIVLAFLSVCSIQDVSASSL